jgi:hypothetical protein
MSSEIGPTGFMSPGVVLDRTSRRMRADYHGLAKGVNSFLGVIVGELSAIATLEHRFRINDPLFYVPSCRLTRMH